MGISVGDILWASLLFINAIAILNEDRFLARIGWSTASLAATQPNNLNQYDSYGGVVDPIGGGGGAGAPGLKSRLINLIGAVRTLMRIPLIALNVVVILYELALG